MALHRALDRAGVEGGADRRVGALVLAEGARQVEVAGPDHERPCRRSDASRPARIQKRPGSRCRARRFGGLAHRRDTTIRPGGGALKRPAGRRSPSAAASPANRRAPSVPPCAGSAARSGCGIRPSTRRFAERMPAMSRCDPFGFGGVAEGDAVLALEPGERRGVGDVVAVVVGDRAGGCARRGRSRAVNALASVATVSAAGAQTNLSPALRISAPGSSPVSISTWKPLQTPRTWPPPSREVDHRPHHRRARGDGAAAQVVAEGEAAGDRRRGRARRAGRSPCARPSRPRRRRRASATARSRSQFEPGKTMTAAFIGRASLSARSR